MPKKKISSKKKTNKRNVSLKSKGKTIASLIKNAVKKLGATEQGKAMIQPAATKHEEYLGQERKKKRKAFTDKLAQEEKDKWSIYDGEHPNDDVEDDDFDFQSTDVTDPSEAEDEFDFQNIYNQEELKKKEQFRSLREYTHGSAEDAAHPTNQGIIAKFFNDFVRGIDSITRSNENEQIKVTKRQGKYETAYDDFMGDPDSQTEDNKGYYFDAWGLRFSAKANEIGIAVSQGAVTRYMHEHLKVQPETILMSTEDAKTNHGVVMYIRMLGAGFGVKNYKGMAPHMAMAAARVANITTADSVRIEDAGSGISAVFASRFNPASIELVDTDATRRSVFRQAVPELAENMVAESSGAKADVVITSNSEVKSIKELLEGVSHGGRLIIAGNQEWNMDAMYALNAARGFSTRKSFWDTLNADQSLSDERKRSRLRLFDEIRDTNIQVQGGMEFTAGPASANLENIGNMIVIDNVPKYTDSRIDPPIDLDNAFQQFKVMDNADLLRMTRIEPTNNMIKNKQAVLEQKKRRDDARDKSIRHLNASMKTGVRILPRIPEMKHRIMGIGQQIASDGIIPSGYEVKSLSEIAVIAESFKNPAMATIQVLLVRNGVIEASVLAKTKTAGDIDITAAEVQSMMPKMEAEGYQVYVVSNRPSGDVNITDAERNLVRQLADTYDGFKHLVVKDGDAYSAITKETDSDGNHQMSEMTNQTISSADQRVRPQQGSPQPALPSWLEDQDQSDIDRYMRDKQGIVDKLNNNLEQLSMDEINTLFKLVESEDNWVILAFVDNDGVLVDMVEIPDAMEMPAQTIQTTVSRIQGMFDQGLSTYAFISSEQHIEPDSDANFFETGWGRYLSTEHSLKGHYLIAGGLKYPGKAVQTYGQQYRDVSETSMTETLEDNVVDGLPKQLMAFFGDDVPKGNMWTNIKAIFRNGLTPPVEQDKNLTAKEIRVLHRQLQIAAARAMNELSLDPHISDDAEAKAVYKSLIEKFKEVNDGDNPLYKPGGSVHPATAYLMNFVANMQKDELVVVAEAGTGEVAALAKNGPSRVLLTESDPTMQKTLEGHIGFPSHTIRKVSADQLTSHWDSNPNEQVPNTILLNARTLDGLWGQINSSLQTLADDGRLVVHFMLDAAEREKYGQLWEVNSPLVDQWYNLRCMVSHEGRGIMVIDKSKPDKIKPITGKYNDANTFVTIINNMRKLRKRTVPAPEQQQEQPRQQLGRRPQDPQAQQQQVQAQPRSRVEQGMQEQQQAQPTQPAQSRVRKTEAEAILIMEGNSESQIRASEIRQVCEEHGITTLVHFTEIKHLSNILYGGLLDHQSLLEKDGQQFKPNDEQRWDGHKDAICLSISFPNSQLFSKFSWSDNMGRPDYSRWVVLLLDAKVLWELDCAFCQENAASNAVRHIRLEDRKKPDALKGMFIDVCRDTKGDVYKRQSMQIPDDYPTHPQAEVLVFSQIPSNYIKEVHFYDETVLKAWRDNNPWINPERLLHNQQYFNKRNQVVWQDNNLADDDIPFGSDTSADDDGIPF